MQRQNNVPHSRFKVTVLIFLVLGIFIGNVSPRILKDELNTAEQIKTVILLDLEGGVTGMTREEMDMFSQNRRLIPDEEWDAITKYGASRYRLGSRECYADMEQKVSENGDVWP